MPSANNLQAAAAKPEDRETALKFLKAASGSGDTARLEELFAAGQLDSNDATERLKHFHIEDSIEILECLLQHGADLNALDIRKAPSLDKLQVLDDHGFDIRGQGHLVLEQVFVRLGYE